MKKTALFLIFFLLILVSYPAFTQVAKSTLVPYYNSHYYLWGFKDSLTGKLVVPLQYDFTRPFSDGMAYVSKGGKAGFIDHTGKLVIGLNYNEADDFRNGLALVVKEEKYGFIKKTGKEAIPLKYDLAEPFSDGLAYIMTEGKCGYIDRTGKMVIKAEFNDAGNFTEGVTWVLKEGGYGIIDKTGKWLLPVQYNYEEFGHATEGMISFYSSSEGKYGFFDRSGKIAITPSYDAVESFSQGVAIVEQHGKYGLIDKKNIALLPCNYESIYRVPGYPDLLEVIPEDDFQTWFYNIRLQNFMTEAGFEETGQFADGLCVVHYDGMAGYINAEGRLLIPVQYDYAGDFRNGVAVVEAESRMHIIDKTGKRLSEPYGVILWMKNGYFAANNGGNFDYVLGYLPDGLYGFLDRRGKALTGVIYEWMEEYNDDGVARVIENGNYNVVDTMGRTLIDREYAVIQPFSEEMAAVNIGGEYDELSGSTIKGEWGYIDKFGKLVIPVVYDDGMPFSEGLAMVLKDSAIYYIDIKGKEVISLAGYDFGGNFKDGLALVLKDGLYGYIDKTGRIVIPLEYTEATSFGDGLARVGDGYTRWIINTNGERVK